MSLHNAVQRIRKLFGLRNSYVDRATGGSGSITVIPNALEENKGTVSLGLVRKYEQYKKYDPIPYNRFDVPHGIGRVSTHFNVMCSKVGLQAVVRADPTDWKALYEFRNVGKMLIKIRWMENKQSHEVLLEPGENTTFKLSSMLDQSYPEIKAFHYDQSD